MDKDWFNSIADLRGQVDGSPFTPSPLRVAGREAAPASSVLRGRALVTLLHLFRRQGRGQPTGIGGGGGRERKKKDEDACAMEAWGGELGGWVDRKEGR